MGDRGATDQRMMFPKTKPIRDAAFLDFIRSKPCLVCNAMSVPHHLKTFGTGKKCDDWLTVPLCPKHHTASDKSVHSMGEKRFCEYWGVNVWEKNAGLQVEYHREAA